MLGQKSNRSHKKMQGNLSLDFLAFFTETSSFSHVIKTNNNINTLNSANTMRYCQVCHLRFFQILPSGFCHVFCLPPCTRFTSCISCSSFFSLSSMHKFPSPNFFFNADKATCGIIFVLCLTPAKLCDCLFNRQFIDITQNNRLSGIQALSYTRPEIQLKSPPPLLQTPLVTSLHLEYFLYVQTG